MEFSEYAFEAMSLQSLRTMVKSYFSTFQKGSKAKKKDDPYEQRLFSRMQSITSDEDRYKEVYCSLFFSVLGVIEKCGFEAWCKEIEQDIWDWDSQAYYEYQDNEKRTILNITRPLEVEEGIYTCPRCKGNKTHHYSRQVRSADEPATTFITCANRECQHRWKIN
jgi:DNA-directed RNA polymerase subunit M/transcription elongation factor TFIIS